MLSLDPCGAVPVRAPAPPAHISLRISPPSLLLLYTHHCLPILFALCGVRVHRLETTQPWPMLLKSRSCVHADTGPSGWLKSSSLQMIPPGCTRRRGTGKARHRFPSVTADRLAKGRFTCPTRRGTSPDVSLCLPDAS